MKTETRETLRDAFLMCAVVLTFPLWLSVYWKWIGFKTMGMLLSLVPGIPGLWLRRAFYHMTLKDAPTDISIDFCSVFLDRDVRLGSGVSIGAWCSVNRCRIGDGTLIGSHVDIFSGRHQHGDGTALGDGKSGWKTAGPVETVRIGKNVWIGNGVTLLDDVGDNSIVGAGSVVVRPIPENCVAVGNPARLIRQK